jgi:hypothetical protein
MKRTVFGLVMAIAALVLLVPMQDARAQSGKNSLMVLYAESDALDDGQKEALLAAQKATLAKYGKYTLLDTPQVDFLDEMVNFECLEMDAGCLSKIVAGKDGKAALALYTSYDGAKAVVKYIDVKKAKVIKEHEVTADADALADNGEAAVVALFGKLPEKKAALVAVKINANVEKAEVFVDQKRVGVTPLELKLKEGKYTVSVRKQDFLMVEEALVVKGAKEVSWSATLKPVPKKVVTVVTPVKPVKPGDKNNDKKKDDDEVKPIYATWWFWTIVGAAVVTTATVTAVAVGGSDSGSDVGTVKFSINSAAAEKDFIFYE